MTYPLDIHTHLLPLHPSDAIVSVSPADFRSVEGGCYSVGIHPWHLPESLAAVQSQLDLLHCCVQHPQVLAIGEAGIDKLVAVSPEQQASIFEAQAHMAEEVGKPVVIHAVKAAEELLRSHRRLNPSVAWIIHGFRGKASVAQMYLQKGFYLSFGERFQPEAVAVVPSHRLFVETDESDAGIVPICRKIAAVRGVSEDDLYETLRTNVSTLFFRG